MFVPKAGGTCFLPQVDRILRTVVYASVADLAAVRKTYLVLRHRNIIRRTHLCTDPAVDALIIHNIALRRIPSENLFSKHIHKRIRLHFCFRRQVCQNGRDPQLDGPIYQIRTRIHIDTSAFLGHEIKPAGMASLHCINIIPHSKDPRGISSRALIFFQGLFSQPLFMRGDYFVPVSATPLT